MNPWLSLTLAIILEVIATTLLKISDGFSKWLPAVRFARPLCRLLLLRLACFSQHSGGHGLCHLVGLSASC